METTQNSRLKQSASRKATPSKTIDRFIAATCFITPFVAYFALIHKNVEVGVGAIIFGVLAHRILRYRQGIKVRWVSVGNFVAIAVLCLLAFGLYRNSYWSGFIGIFIALNYAVVMARTPKSAYLKKRKFDR